MMNAPKSPESAVSCSMRVTPPNDSAEARRATDSQNLAEAASRRRLRLAGWIAWLSFMGLGTDRAEARLFEIHHLAWEIESHQMTGQEG